MYAFLLTLASLFAYSQEEVAEQPTLKLKPTSEWRFFEFSPIEGDENSPFRKSYPRISKFPENLTDIRYGFIETDVFQFVYQNYLLGNFTEAHYERLQTMWNWGPDTLRLSKIPMQTSIAVAFATDSEGNTKIAVDVNNNLDFRDDIFFIPPVQIEIYNNFLSVGLINEVLATYAIDVSFEKFVRNEIVRVTVPLLIVYNSLFDIFMWTMPKYFNFEKEQTATAEESTNLSEVQLTSTEIGSKPYQFHAKEFITEEIISLENLRGKYVLLYFFATWCVPCIADMPRLQELYSKVDTTKFEMIGIVGRSPAEGLTRLINRHSVTWPQVMSDNTNRLVEIYGIRQYPTTILLDTNGYIIAKNLRGRELEEKILKLTKE